MQPAVDAYLRTLAAGLPGSRRARASILAEVADGLTECAEAYEARGLPAAAAARAAITEFGDPTELAAEFAGELAGVTAHRVGLALILTGPLVGAAWLAAYAARSGYGLREQLHHMPGWLVVLAVLVPAAVLATATGAGPLVRWLRPLPAVAATAAVVAAGGCVIVDAMMLAALAWYGGAWPVLALPAVAASAVRLPLAGVAARRCALLRQAAGATP